MQIKFTSKPTYAEEGQPNPIRWAILSGTPETGFINETSWLRCKDFFNDYCVAYNGGKRFNIYGFSTEKMNIPKKGEPVYIALDATTEAFPFNLGEFNTWLKGQELPTIVYTPYISMWVLEFPEFYFNNTYNISLVSLIIRLLNVDKEFTSFEEVIKYKDFPAKDQQKWDVAVASGIYFKLPDAANKYVWYIDKNTNSEKTDSSHYSYSSLVHNNGLISWTNSLKDFA